MGTFYFLSDVRVIHSRNVHTIFSVFAEVSGLTAGLVAIIAIFLINYNQACFMNEFILLEQNEQNYHETIVSHTFD